MDSRTLFGLVVFLTVIALTISRPRGLNEAWPAVGGAGALLALGFLTLSDLVGAARETAGVLPFLLGMMVLSTALEMAGVFTWAASYAARASGGRSRRLLINIFLLGRSRRRCLSFIAASVGIGCIETAEHTAVALLAPVDVRGSAFGILAGVQGFGNLAASAVAGLIWSTVSGSAAFIYLAAWMLLALTGITAAARAT